jgi:predicted negative regulator of RcsB-dependent stress response
LTYFWNDSIGDIFAEHGDKAKAKSHYETAVASTKIDGYKKKTQEKLAALQ